MGRAEPNSMKNEMFVKIKICVWNAVKRSNVREGYDNERNVNQIL